VIILLRKNHRYGKQFAELITQIAEDKGNRCRNKAVCSYSLPCAGVCMAFFFSKSHYHCEYAIVFVYMA